MTIEFKDFLINKNMVKEAYLHKNCLVTSLPSNPLVIDEALRLAEIKRGKDVVYDPACGDGRAPIRAV